MKRVKEIIKRHFPKIMTAAAMTGTMACGTVSSFAASTPSYTPKPVPTATTMDLSSLGELWAYAQSMLQDVIAIISNHGLLVCLVLVVPLIGLGVSLFKRIVY